MKSDELLPFVDQLEETMNKLSKEELVKPIAEGKWSKYQIFVHIIDSELVYITRLKRVLTQNEPELPGWQQPEWVALEDKEIDITTNIAAIRAVRNKLVGIIKHLSDDDFKRYGIHLKYGRLTFEELVQRMVNHSNDHMKAIIDNFSKDKI